MSLFIFFSTGDIDLNSWFEGGSSVGRIDEIELTKDVSAILLSGVDPTCPRKEQTDWWRMLSLRISNSSVGIFERGDSTSLQISALNKPLDLSLVLQKSAWNRRALALRCKLSMVEMAVKYSEYCQAYAVLRENIGRSIDKERWDNVEKAYDLEVELADEGTQPTMALQAGGGQLGQTKRVEYACAARRIRYGTKSERLQSSKSPAPGAKNGASQIEKEPSAVDLKFMLDGFALKLSRDDPVEGIGDPETALTFEYDMILLRVQVVEVSIKSEASEDYSFHLSLYRIGLFDLGDQGRLLRENFLLSTQKERHKRTVRLPCAFSVLVEGYSPGGQLSSASDVKRCEDDDAQLVITVDKVPSSSVGTIGSLENPLQKQGNDKVTVARAVINFLSVNARIRPFKELTAFLAMSWPVSDIKLQDQIAEISDATKKDSRPAAKSSHTCLQLKLVAHYPRIFFVADESDPHSRALVLRG
jgi:hypothetical protein